MTVCTYCNQIGGAHKRGCPRPIARPRFTIWQCTDFCCERKPFSDKWWNVGINPDNYHSVSSWRKALSVAASGKLPWT